jgi:uncharacterized protein YndB with AHSA1/START domain
MPAWQHSIDIEASPERVWEVMADIERWPEWTSSIISIEKLTEGDLAVGTRARVHALGAPESEFTVTSAEPGNSFTWETRVRGARSIAGHVIEPTASGSRATLSIEVGGIVAALLRPILSRTVVRNLRFEAEGLKQRAESP